MTLGSGIAVAGIWAGAAAIVYVVPNPWTAFFALLFATGATEQVARGVLFSALVGKVKS